MVDVYLKSFGTTRADRKVATIKLNVLEGNTKGALPTFRYRADGSAGLQFYDGPVPFIFIDMAPQSAGMKLACNSMPGKVHGRYIRIHKIPDTVTSAISGATRRASRRTTFGGPLHQLSEVAVPLTNWNPFCEAWKGRTQKKVRDGRKRRQN